jgi:hypothetical protein
MQEVLFTYRPQHAVWLKWVPGIIPLFLVPAAFAIYFTEGKNLPQLLSILAFAILLTLTLYGLIRFSEEKITERGFIEITPKGLLRWKFRNDLKEIQLQNVRSIHGGSDFIMTELVLEEKNGNKTTLTLPGYFAKKPRDEFYRTALKFGVTFE